MTSRVRLSISSGRKGVARLKMGSLALVTHGEENSVQIMLSSHSFRQSTHFGKFGGKKKINENCFLFKYWFTASQISCKCVSSFDYAYLNKSEIQNKHQKQVSQPWQIISHIIWCDPKLHSETCIDDGKHCVRMSEGLIVKWDIPNPKYYFLTWIKFDWKVCI